ncbi:unnamed protein product [Amoebophrya sp. A25]|nr:unnamed protein product [Amoebophrya sp. A25]|eukprot:GSA25T00012695001.1
MWPFSRKKDNKDGENKPWRAKFNESGMDMYYNKELKCWVERGKEEEMRKTLADMLPSAPPSASELQKQTEQPGGGSSKSGGGSSADGQGISAIDAMMQPPSRGGGGLDSLLRPPSRPLPGRGGSGKTPGSSSLIPYPRVRRG